MSRVHCVKAIPLAPSLYVTERGNRERRTVLNKCGSWPCLKAAEFVLANNRRQRLGDRSSIASPDVMLLVAFTHWRGQADFGVTLMCHPDLDTSFQCGLISVCVLVWRSAIGLVWFFLHKQENVDLLSVIPPEQASLEGTVPQKQGHCCRWMAGANLVEAVVCRRGFWADWSPRVESSNNPKREGGGGGGGKIFPF